MSALLAMTECRSASAGLPRRSALPRYGARRHRPHRAHTTPVAAHSAQLPGAKHANCVTACVLAWAAIPSRPLDPAFCHRHTLYTHDAPGFPESTGGPGPRLRLTPIGGGHGDDNRLTERMFGEWVGPDDNVLVPAAPGRHPADIERDVDRLAGRRHDVGVTGTDLLRRQHRRWHGSTRRGSRPAGGPAARRPVRKCPGRSGNA